MAIKQESHIIKGIQRDLTKSKFSSEYAFDAYNIRLTARDGDTLMSVTNEKGTKKIPLRAVNTAETSLIGTVVGYTVLNDFVVIFTTSNTELQHLDRIYRLLDKGDYFEFTQLYKGNLNLSTEYPIESLGIFENDNILKVYWVDGRNQPRVINIVKDKLIGKTPDYKDTSFDFVLELSLNEDVTIERVILGNGVFSPGTIQYAFTYYNKYGQESNIFNTSELFYLSHPNRGASPEDKVNNSFSIKVENPDTNFEYLRIYSIHRTSKDATPEVKKVVDLPTKREYELELTGAYLAQYVRTINNRYIIEDVESSPKLVEEYPTISLPSGGALAEGEYYYFSKEDYPHLIIDIGSNGIITWGTNTDIYIAKEALNGPGDTADGPLIMSLTGDIIRASYGKYIILKDTSYIDNGTTGETVDPTLLLYIGGESIIANTITQKDLTLFLGNIKISRPSIEESLIDSIREDMREKVGTISRSIQLNNLGEDGYYIYHNQLSKGNTSGFKSGEHYRIGVLFQYKTGKWSDPIFITDHVVSSYYTNRPTLNGDILTIPNITTSLKESLRNLLKLLGYKRYRGVVVFPELHNRLIITQGMLCPTVFMAGNRKNNTPFAQSSWFVRPNLPINVDGATGDDFDYINNNANVDKGAWVEFRHLHSLKSKYDRGAEVLNMNSSPAFSTVNNAMLSDSDSYFSTFMVDLSIITIHSPDIEFDTSFSSLDGADLNMRIVGLINFTASIGDIDIQTSTPPIHSESSGFTRRSLGSINADPMAARSLVSGLFYKDYLVNDTKDAEDYEASGFQAYEYGFMVYPWHRSGSINNDINRPAGKGTRSSVLSKKVISNMKFSEYNTWLSNVWDTNTLTEGITEVQYFNSNEVSLIKIPIPEVAKVPSMNYYGNIDTLVPSLLDYGTIHAVGKDGAGYVSFNDTPTADTLSNLSGIFETFIGNYEGNLRKSKDPIRMKYKSTPHLVFGFNCTSSQSLFILPSVYNLNSITDKTVPFWNKDAEISSGDDSIPEIVYRELVVPSTKYTELKANKDGITYWVLPTDRGGILWKYTGIPIDTEEWGTIGWEKVSLSEESRYQYKGTDRVYFYEGWNNGSTFVLKESDLAYNKEYSIIQGNINVKPIYPYLFLAELYRDNVTNAFGTVEDNLWLPAGPSVSLDLLDINYEYGDTWYQRYDCLKTYPFTREDENLVVEIASFMCETRVNIDGRYDRNRGQASNLNMSPTNFNLLNPIYSLKDNFFNYRILDSDLYKLNEFSNSITWTREKSLAEVVDTWTNITMASTLDLDGDKGNITSLNTFNNEIYCFQLRGLSNILFNSRVLIPTSDGVPIEITNGLKVQGKRYISDSIGCYNKWSIVESPIGLYFMDSETSSIYLFNGQINSISNSLGFSNWAKGNITNDIWNPNSFNNFISYYDKANGDIYFISKETCLCYSEKLGLFTSFMSYENIYPIFNVSNSLYSFKNSNMWKHFEGDYNMFFGEYKPFYVTVISNLDMPYDKIYNTIEFRADSWEGEELSLETTFDTLEVWNEYLYGLQILNNTIGKPSPLKRKFRVWRANVPRDSKNLRDRIRNTWAYIKLSKNIPTKNKFELHDIMVHYFI